MKRFLICYIIVAIIVALGYFGFNKCVRVGYANAEGKIIVPIKYDSVRPSFTAGNLRRDEASFISGVKNGKADVYNNKGDLLYSSEKFPARIYHPDLILTSKGEFIDDRGNIIHELSGYDIEPSDLSDHLFSIKKYKIKPVDSNGHNQRDISMNIYDAVKHRKLFAEDAESVETGLPDKLCVKKAGKYGLYDRSGKEIVPVSKNFPVYDVFKDVYVSSEFKVGESNFLVLRDKNDRIISDYHFAYYCIFRGKLYVEVMDNSGYKSKSAYKEYRDNSFRDTSFIFKNPTHSDYNAVKINGKWGLFDKEGGQILSPVYDNFNFRFNIKDYRNIYPVVKNGKAGAVGPGDKTVIPFRYGGLSVDKKKGYIKVFDTKPDPSVSSAPIDPDDIYNNNLVPVVNSCGILDLSGSVIIPQKYANIKKAGDFYTASINNETDPSCNILHIYTDKGELIKELKGLNPDEWGHYNIGNVMFFEGQHIDTPVDYDNVKLMDLSSMKEYANAKEYIMDKNSLSEKGSRLYVYPMTGTQGYMLVKFDIRGIFGGAK